MIPEVSPPEIQVVRIGIARVPPGERVQALGREPKTDLLRDRRAQLLLQPQHAGGLAIVGLGPHLHLIANANQLGCDPPSAALRPNRALHKVNRDQHRHDVNYDGPHGNLPCCSPT